MKFETLKQTKFHNLTIEVKAPEGTMFVAIIEDNNSTPIAIDITIGKAGTLIQAWAHSMARILTVALEHGATLENFIEELSSQHSSKARRSIDSQVDIWSGPEAICMALLKYKRQRFERVRQSFGIIDADDANTKGRESRLRQR